MKSTLRIFVIAAALLLTTQAASAGLFDWLTIPGKQRQTPTAAAQSNDKDAAFSSLYMQTVSPLNTPENIKQVSTYMDGNKLQTIQVQVTDLNKAFYVVSGAGTTLTPPTRIDKTLRLTTGQVKDAASILADGQISYFERMRLYFILNQA